MALSDNIWWTRKSRIHTEKRLLKNAFHAQVILLWYSIFSVFVAVYYLNFNIDSQYSGVAWVVFSVLVLVMSVFINGLGFKERAALVKESYETLNQLYHDALLDKADIQSLNENYKQILSVCENHTDRDYTSALCTEYLNHPNPKNKETGLSKIPTKYNWFMYTVYLTKMFVFTIILYSLPIAVFAVIDCL